MAGMFADAKVGDKVWHFLFGWGEVKAVNERTRTCHAEFPGYNAHRDGDIEYVFFDVEGKTFENTLNPCVFWGEIDIKSLAPSKPKRKVWKKICGWVYYKALNNDNVINSVYSNYNSHVFVTKEIAENHRLSYSEYVGPFYVEHMCEVEE